MAPNRRAAAKDRKWEEVSATQVRPTNIRAVGSAVAGATYPKPRPAAPEGVGAEDLPRSAQAENPYHGFGIGSDDPKPRDSKSIEHHSSSMSDLRQRPTTCRNVINERLSSASERSRGHVRHPTLGSTPGVRYHNYASGTGLVSGAVFGRLAGRNAVTESGR
jgi:hypothetical protein